MTEQTMTSVLLWGGKGSGKSGLLGALWQAGGTSADGSGRWCISPGDIHDAVTKNYLIDAYTMLREGQRRATMPASEYPELRMTARRWVAGSPRAALDLTFTDPAGEYADDPVRARQQGTELLDRMMTGGGVIWLFDAMADSRPHLDQVVRQIGTLRERMGGGVVQTPVAFCLSRIDLINDEQARVHVRRDPRNALGAVLGEDIMAQLEGAFPRHRCFAISSRGFTPGKVDPVGLNEVLDWVHGNQRSARLAASARRWSRPAAAAAAVLVAGWLGVHFVTDYFFGEGATERRRVEQQELGRLELGGRLYADGQADSAVAVLQAVALPGRHARAVERDTLLALAAHQAGATRMLSSGGEMADSLLRVAAEHSRRAARGLRSEAAVARFRFLRAEACMLTRCDEGEIDEDLEYVVKKTSDPQLRRLAQERLNSTRRS
jgi:hypothetical protein